MNKHRFSDAERQAIYKVISHRRDMRHFRPDPIDDETLSRILEAAHQAPSVGLMQPWRFIQITQTSMRQQIHQLVRAECQLTANELELRKDEFLNLKLEGILECAELLVAALPDKRESEVFGRRTLPEMDLASVSCAIQNLWLAARAEGIGMGWVSLFDPKTLARLLGMPEGAKPVAILCLGYVDEFYDKPLLEQEKWRTPRPLKALLSQDSWNQDPDA